MNRYNTRKRKIRNWVLFTLYIVVLLYLLFFSDYYGRTNLYEDYQYNLVPFKEIKLYKNLLGSGRWWLFFLNVFGNIIIFIPYGYLVSNVFYNKLFFVALLGCLFSLIIESIQLFTKVGVFDVDDIILNTSGVILGIIFWKIDFIVRSRKR